MVKKEYIVDEEDKSEGEAPEMPEMKQSFCVYDKDVKGISESKLGEEVSFVVKGKIASISKGMGEEGPEARVEIDSIEKGGN